VSADLPELATGLVDPGAVEALFGGMDSDTQALLISAACADTAEWTERLVAAWRNGDSEGQSRARHSLRGICGNFGMTALLASCEDDLSASTAVQDLCDCRETSLAALRAVVASLQ